MTDRKTQQMMQAIAQGLDKGLNEPGKKDIGFVVLLFPFNAPEGARTNYVSNCDRKDVLVALKEVVARFEGAAEQKGTA